VIFYLEMPFNAGLTEVDKYRNPLVVGKKICLSYDQNIKTNYKLLISVVNDCRKEIGENSHAEN
jgi:hypothetical protein